MSHLNYITCKSAEYLTVRVSRDISNQEWRHSHRNSQQPTTICQLPSQIFLNLFAFPLYVIPLKDQALKSSMAAYRLLACIMLGWRLIVSILLTLCYFAPLYARRKLLWSFWRVTHPLFKFLEFAAIVISTKAGATNHLSGHHDLMAGVITCNMILQRWFCYVGMWARCCQDWQIAFTINAAGHGLSPIDSLLLLCGIKVLSLCMNHQQSTPSLIANLCQLFWSWWIPRKRDPHTGYKQKWCSIELWTGSKLLSESIVVDVRPETYSGLKIDKFCDFILQKDEQRIHYCKVANKKHKGLCW